MNTYFAGVDVGLTKTAVGLFKSLGDQQPVAFRTFPTANDAETDLNNLVDTLRAMAAEHDGQIGGIGVGIAGRLDTKRTTVLSAGGLLGWLKKPIQEHLQAAFPNVPIVLGNDAEAQAIAEAVSNETVKGEDFLLIAIGTGIGVARILQVNGQPVPLAMEPHVDLNPFGDNSPHVCGCGLTTCWERYASGAGVGQRFGKKAAHLTPEEWDESVGWMARGVATLLPTHIVPFVVMTGGVMARQPHLVELLEKKLSETHLTIDAPKVISSVSLLKGETGGAEGGVLGGLALLNMVVTTPATSQPV